MGLIRFSSTLIGRDGKPLVGSEARKEQQRVEKEISELEKGKSVGQNNRKVKLEDLQKTSLFTSPSSDSIYGRSVWITEFHPNPSVKPANANERFAHGLVGKLWIDSEASQIARIETVLREAFNVAGGLLFSMKAGTRFTAEETWSFSQIWLPKLRRIEMNAKAMMGVKLQIEDLTTFSGYHQFNVHSPQILQ